MLKGTDVEKITLNTIIKWNQEIKNDSELVSFSILEEPVVDIIQLIKIRCKVIRLMLKSE